MHRRKSVTVGAQRIGTGSFTSHSRTGIASSVHSASQLQRHMGSGTCARGRGIRQLWGKIIAMSFNMS